MNEGRQGPSWDSDPGPPTVTGDAPSAAAKRAPQRPCPTRKEGAQRPKFRQADEPATGHTDASVAAKRAPQRPCPTPSAQAPARPSAQPP